MEMLSTSPRIKRAFAIFATALCHVALAADPAPNQDTAAGQQPAAVAAAGESESGLAAVYSDRLNGRKTASGERYDRNALTAAHKRLPFGTRVKVTNTKNSKSVTLRINDRGPTQAGRILDISPRAARALGIHTKGMAQVTMEVTAQAPAEARGH
jgi:rare lipoprotein A